MSRAGIYTRNSLRSLMASMVTCPCGWTLISPQGEEDARKHVKIHLTDVHPGSVMTDEELTKTIKTF